MSELHHSCSRRNFKSSDCPSGTTIHHIAYPGLTLLYSAQAAWRISKNVLITLEESGSPCAYEDFALSNRNMGQDVSKPEEGASPEQVPAASDPTVGIHRLQAITVRERGNGVRGYQSSMGAGGS